jgi:hypothetical protein
MTAQITAFLKRNNLCAEYVTELCTEQEHGHFRPLEERVFFRKDAA